jgi:hypothetical protein
MLLTGFVMMRGAFNKPTAYLGVVTGILGIVSVVGPMLLSAQSAAVIITSVLTTIWVLLVGYRLLRLGL